MIQGNNLKKKTGSGKKEQWADHYTQRAKAENYPARSVFKLMEIQKKFKLIKKGFIILDLGCSPGSWLIYAARETGSGGKAVGIDLKPVEAPIPKNARAYTGDIFEMGEELTKQVGENYDVVLSDMAPATTGRKDIDAARSFELCRAALDRALALLKPGGNFACKIFQGQEFKTFENEVKSMFKQHRIFKPESCRKSSKEIYLIGIGKV